MTTPLRWIAVFFVVLGLPLAVEAAQADLSWTPPAPSPTLGTPTGIRIERSDDGGAFVNQTPTPLPPDRTGFSQLNIPDGKDYVYRVIYFNGFADAEQPWPSIGSSAKQPGNANNLILIIKPSTP